MKIKVAIVEDSDQDKKLLESNLLAFQKEHNNVSFDIEWFNLPSKFIDKYEPIYQIIFMDIDMPGINGLDVSKQLRQKDKNVTLIFTTNLSQYAINGYEVQAYDFFVKPINKEFFNRKMEKLINNISSSYKETINIKTKQGFFVIKINDIIYVESNDHKITYHTVNGEYSNFSSMKDVINLLPNDIFTLCNQSYLVNMNYIEKVNNYDLIIHGETLLISHPKKKAFIEAFTDFVSRGI